MVKTALGRSVWTVAVAEYGTMVVGVGPYGEAVPDPDAADAPAEEADNAGMDDDADGEDGELAPVSSGRNPTKGACSPLMP
jgi:hypothetical protein